jgi:hypothetical protein
LKYDTRKRDIYSSASSEMGWHRMNIFTNQGENKMQVKCIDNSNVSSCLTLNKIYVVTQHPLYTDLWECEDDLGITCGYKKNRFTTVTGVVSATCIDAFGFMGILTKGKVYDIEPAPKIGAKYIRVLKNDFGKELFTLLDRFAAIGGNISKAVLPADQKDIADLRKWANNLPGECPCGVPRATCDYHK